MPFEPLPPDKQERYNESICISPQHNPPSMIVIKVPMVWVCPNCGQRVTVYPTVTRC